MANKTLVLVGGTFVALVVSGCPVKDDYFLESDGPNDGVSGSVTTAGTGSTTSGGTESVLPTGGTGQGADTQGGAPGTSGTGAQASGGTGGSDIGGSSAGGTDPVGGMPSDAGAPSTVGSDVGGSGGSDSGGAGGTSGTAGSDIGGTSGSGGSGGSGGTGGTGGSGGCKTTTERCNGIDDDCDGTADDSNVCPNGCSGFVIDESSGLGYMYCTSRKDFQHARDACNNESMHLAWVESLTENQLVSEHLDALGDDTEVLIGASDQQKEGDWVWYGGGPLFWKGNQNGYAVNGAFVAWAPGVPDSFGGNEDCAVLNPTTQRWSDRPCSTTFSYVCESAPVNPR